MERQKAGFLFLLNQKTLVKQMVFLQALSEFTI